MIEELDFCISEAAAISTASSLSTDVVSNYQQMLVWQQRKPKVLSHGSDTVSKSQNSVRRLVEADEDGREWQLFRRTVLSQCNLFADPCPLLSNVPGTLAITS